MNTQGRKYPEYATGDRVKDLTFDPSPIGAIVAKHPERADAYLVRLDGGQNDVVIHARNLQVAS